MNNNHPPVSLDIDNLCYAVVLISDVRESCLHPHNNSRHETYASDKHSYIKLRLSLPLDRRKLQR